tara:strand:+ start:993 stop:1232 length:240 start_codon:yes stop_codon:yes gene_type:complete
VIEVVSYYFAVLLLFQPIEEIHNCENPNLIERTPHLLCVWEEKDFYRNKQNKLILRKKRKTDNFIKAYYRRKYWNDRRI